jgi:hypothetical protein
MKIPPRTGIFAGLSSNLCRLGLPGVRRTITDASGALQAMTITV